jgi:hypothetical protein
MDLPDLRGVATQKIYGIFLQKNICEDSLNLNLQ